MAATDAALGKFSDEHPDGAWITDTMLGLLHRGVESLRAYIENPDEPEITWQSPVVELQYPVEWDWAAVDAGETPGGMLRPELSEQDVETLDSAVGRSQAIVGTRRIVQALHALTSGMLAWHAADLAGPGGGPTLVPLRETEDAITGIVADLGVTGQDAERLRAAIAWTMAQPVYLGAEPAYPDEDTAPDEDTIGISEWFARHRQQLPVIRDLADLSFEAEAPDGKPYLANLVASVSPLMVDADRRTAHYPMQVGLYFISQGGIESTARGGFWGRMPEPPDPSAWPAKAQVQVWERLLAMIERLRPEPDREGAGRESLPAPAVVEPASEADARILFDGATRADRGTVEALGIIAGANGVRLPRQWDKVPRLVDLEKAEVARLLARHGDEAFEPHESGKRAWLKKPRRRLSGESVIELASEGRKQLLSRMGNRGYRELYRGRECLVRRFQAGSYGHATIRISWFDQAGYLHEDYRERLETSVNEVKDETDADMFLQLDEDVRTKLNGELRRLQSVKDALPVMRHIVNVFGRDGTNPITIPAWEVRKLLDCEDDHERGHARATGCLSALRRLEYSFSTAGIGAPREGEGGFISDWEYAGSGEGSHTDGLFTIEVSRRFIGCLEAFSIPSSKITGRTFDFARRLPAEHRKALRESPYVQSPTALLPFHDRARDFTDMRSRLSEHVARRITRRKDGVRSIGGKPWAHRASAKAADANEARLYDSSFCPLLPEGRQFHGALDSFKRNPESGRTLLGVERDSSATGGGRPAGLLAEMGYPELPRGMAYARRRAVFEAAIADMRAVVEDAFGGVVAARYKDQWLTSTEALDLPPGEIGRRVRWFLFPASDWQARIHKTIERRDAEDFAAGRVPAPTRVTTDRQMFMRHLERLRGARQGAIPVRPGHGSNETPEAVSSPPPLALHLRLHMKRRKLKLRQVDVARLFGISQQAYAKWEIGTEPDEERKVRGKPISKALEPLVRRWVETGEAPTEAELEALPSEPRRRGTKAPG